MLYEAWGLTLASDRPLPGMNVATRAIDVHIQAGDVPLHLSGSQSWGDFMEASRDAILLRIPDVAMFLVTPSRITYAPHPLARPGAIELYLLGSVAGALLHLRGLLPLHASAVETPAGALLVGGASGAGKSTTAAALTQRGFGLLADDIAAVRLIDGQACIVRGLERQKLWAPALARLGLAPGDEIVLQPGKHQVGPPLMSGAAHVPVHAFVEVCIGTGPRVEVHHLAGAQKFSCLRRNVYRPELLGLLSHDAVNFPTLAALAALPVVQVTRPSGDSLKDVVAAVSSLAAERPVSGPRDGAA